jgi:hypothetical protein
LLDAAEGIARRFTAPEGIFIRHVRSFCFQRGCIAVPRVSLW